jgi:hypothetical protein
MTPDDPNMIEVNRKLLMLAFTVSLNVCRFFLSPLVRIRRGRSLRDLTFTNIRVTAPFLDACLSSGGTFV